MDQHKEYQLWMQQLPAVGERRIKKLLSRFGSEREAYERLKTAGEQTAGELLSGILNKEQAECVRMFTRKWKLKENYERLREQEISFLTEGDGAYPERLRQMETPPYGLYVKGKLPEGERAWAAVIGARECSSYGSFLAQAFGRRLGEAGVVTVSGMARGVDGTAQWAALEGGGKTVGVLGSGVDVCYPASNRKLYERILKGGGALVSLAPPGTPPAKSLFPRRNQIVAGLSDALLVIEARQRSGTFITVDMALEQGKNVYAVPGRITDRLSDGCNMLLRQGAGIALSPEDFLAEVSLLYGRNSFEGEGRREKNRGKRNEKKRDGRAEGEQTGEAADITDEGEKRVLSLLDVTPKSLDELLAELEGQGQELGLSELTSKLILLCLRGEAVQIGGNYGIRQK